MKINLGLWACCSLMGMKFFLSLPLSETCKAIISKAGTSYQSTISARFSPPSGKKFAGKPFVLFN